MARARNIKPGFYKNEDLAECSVWARYIFPGLWMLADREGRLEDRPKRIKGELIPFDSQDIEPLLAELEAHGFLERYQNSDGSFIQISKFLKHQSPHYSEKKSVIKPQILPEKTPDEAEQLPVVLPEHSEKPPPIKRGSKPPDSLNPSSLNPESLKKQPAFILPSWVPSEAWQGFCEMRRKSKGAFTERAKALLVRELFCLVEAGGDAAKILDQSTANGWKGVFPLKANGGNGNGKFNPHAAGRKLYDEAMERELAKRGVGGSAVSPSEPDLHGEVHEQLP